MKAYGGRKKIQGPSPTIAIALKKIFAFFMSSDCDPNLVKPTNDVAVCGCSWLSCFPNRASEL